MAYLSRYTLALADVRALRLTDTYSLHRAVYSLFEDVRGGNAQEHSGILFADKGGDSRGRRLLILSSRAPLAPACGTLESRVVPPEYFTAPFYRFEVTVNPVYRENSSGKLMPLRGREAVADWFCAKAPGWGFQVCPDSLLVARLEVDRFAKGGREITLAKATLTGFLNVTDNALFAANSLHGLGRARAFGCGLLQIVPAQQPR